MEQSPCRPSLFWGFAFQAYFSQDSLQSGPQCNSLGEGLCPHLGSERLFNPRGSSPGPVRDPSLLGVVSHKEGKPLVRSQGGDNRIILIILATLALPSLPREKDVVGQEIKTTLASFPRMCFSRGMSV